MSVTLMLSKQCSRCPRTEQTPVSIDEAVKAAQSSKKEAKALVVQVDGKEFASFDALCSTCKTIVTKYLDNIAKPQKHASSLRGGTEIEVDQ
jgi:hypothetical protein